MIGLVGVRPPPGRPCGVTVLERVPESPAPRYAGFIVRGANRAAVDDVVLWYDALRERRAALALGLVARPDDSAEALAKAKHPVTLFLRPEALIGEAVPAEALCRVRQASVEGRLLEELVEAAGASVLEERRALEALVARGTNGGSVAGAARDLGVNTETLRRRLRPFGLKPSDVTRWTRVRGFEIRVELGTERNAALWAGGWMTHEQRRKTARRARKALNAGPFR